MSAIRAYGCSDGWPGKTESGVGANETNVIDQLLLVHSHSHNTLPWHWTGLALPHAAQAAVRVKDAAGLRGRRARGLLGGLHSLFGRRDGELPVRLHHEFLRTQGGDLWPGCAQHG